MVPRPLNVSVLEPRSIVELSLRARLAKVWPFRPAALHFHAAEVGNRYGIAIAGRDQAFGEAAFGDCGSRVGLHVDAVAAVTGSRYRLDSALVDRQVAEAGVVPQGVTCAGLADAAQIIQRGVGAGNGHRRHADGYRQGPICTDIPGLPCACTRRLGRGRGCARCNSEVSDLCRALAWNS
jgi:hypothetical protein